MFDKTYSRKELYDFATRVSVHLFILYVLCLLLALSFIGYILFKNPSECPCKEEPVEREVLATEPVTLVERYGRTIFSTEEIQDLPVRYSFTEEDIILMAQLLTGCGYIDGDGEYDFDFKNTVNFVEVNKVLGVVINRVKSEDFPNTVKEVILQRNQFVVMPRNLTVTPSDISLETVRNWIYRYNKNDETTMVNGHLYFTGTGIINITRKEYQ